MAQANGTTAFMYRCARCKTARRIEYTVESWKGDWGRRQYRFRRVDDGSIGPGGETCCGRSMNFGQLQAHHSPDTKCDARCTNARGFVCNCSCSGKNHGSGWSTSPGFTSLQQRVEATPEEEAERQAFANAPAHFEGIRAFEIAREAVIEAGQARRAIAARHGVDAELLS